MTRLRQISGRSSNSSRARGRGSACGVPDLSGPLTGRATHEERCPRLEKVTDGLFEGVEAVLHVMGEQIREAKRRSPVPLSLNQGRRRRWRTKGRLGEPAGRAPGRNIRQMPAAPLVRPFVSPGGDPAGEPRPTRTGPRFGSPRPSPWSRAWTGVPPDSRRPSLPGTSARPVEIGARPAATDHRRRTRGARRASRRPVKHHRGWCGRAWSGPKALSSGVLLSGPDLSAARRGVGLGRRSSALRPSGRGLQCGGSVHGQGN